MDHNDKAVVDVQAETSEGDLVEKGHDIKEAWDNIYMDEAFKSKLDSKNVAWNIISNNEDTIDIDDENNKNKDKSDITTSEKARKLKTSLCGNIGSPDRTNQESLARAKKRHQK